MTISLFRDEGLIFFILLALGTAACGNKEVKNSVSESAPPFAGTPRMTGFHMLRYEGPSVSYSLRADRADLRERDKKADVWNPRLVIHEVPESFVPSSGKVAVSSGPVKIHAVGDEGQIDLSTKDVILEGNVVYVVKSKDYTLKTSKLFYWASRHETEVPEGTGYTLTTPNGVMEGLGMVSKEDLD